MSEPLNFLNHKINKLSDEKLLEECVSLVRKMEARALTDKDRELVPIFFTKAIERDTIDIEIKNDLSIALRILNYL
jgi:hypothetical protein